MCAALVSGTGKALGAVIEDVRWVSGNSKSRLFSCTIIAALTAISVHLLRHYSIAHPFLLSDNRHYTFYVWRKFLGTQVYRKNRNQFQKRERHPLTFEHSLVPRESVVAMVERILGSSVPRRRHVGVEPPFSCHVVEDSMAGTHATGF